MKKIKLLKKDFVSSVRINSEILKKLDKTPQQIIDEYVLKNKIVDEVINEMLKK